SGGAALVRLSRAGLPERGGRLDDEAGPAQECQHDEADAIERGVDLEVARQAPADAGQHTVVAAPLEPLDRRSLDSVFAHGAQDRGTEPKRLSGMTLTRL